jgi:hypothetical protein
MQSKHKAQQRSNLAEKLTEQRIALITYSDSILMTKGQDLNFSQLKLLTTRTPRLLPTRLV